MRLGFLIAETIFPGSEEQCKNLVVKCYTPISILLTMQLSQISVTVKCKCMWLNSQQIKT